MKIYIASDHAGFEMKRHLIFHLSQVGHDVYDCGPEEYNPEDDYPDYVSVAAKHVSESQNDAYVRGIVIGWSGQGEAIVSNRFPHIRCAVFYGGTKHGVTLSREHNDSNMLSLGAHFVTTQEAAQTVDLWLKTKFSGEERHKRRIGKIEKLETK